MSDLKIGELYLVKKLYWFLFPKKELATKLAKRVSPGSMVGWLKCVTSCQVWANHAKWLSERYNCNVSVVDTSMYFVLIEQEDEEYFKLLDSNGNIGWIYCWNFSKYFELVKANQ